MEKRFPPLQNGPAAPSPKGPARRARRAPAQIGDQGPAGFDWNDLKYFLAVARHGGLSRAALELDTSASTVSRHITALESRLQVRLFVRLSTGYLLTDAGSELFERVAEVERSTHAVARRSSVAAEDGQVHGLVRLATADSIGTTLLAPRMGLLRDRHPALRVELMLGHAPVDLTRREADLALRILDAHDPASQPDHVMHRIGPVNFHLHASRDLLGGADPARVDWQRLPHVGWDAGYRHLPLARWLDTSFGRPPIFTSNSMAAQMAVVRAGLGVGLLPAYLARQDASLVRLTCAHPPPGRELWLIYHRDLKSSRRVQAVRRFLEENVTSNDLD